MKRGFERKRYNLRSCEGLKTKKKSSLIDETAVATSRLENKKKQATEVPPSFSSSSAEFSRIPIDLIPNILNKLPLYR
ncbi:hypothetical protein FRX31_028299 [Thalictrum thalictroides]|uniref:Uncharacterized protein n=1 Tax=Thalictrum thalictroides TaxID=46969 RepID=A0A7J6VCN2_THATH|nr:hypothetical protein FRX31_028299 [Thalictrum thalictroides]